MHNAMSNTIAQGLYTINCQIKSYKVYTQCNVKYNCIRFIHNKLSTKIVQGLYIIKCQIKSYNVYTQ
jgi:hypothetical protein